MTPLERRADELTADYVRGRWRPEAAEKHHARILASGIDDGLPSVPSSESIGQMPHPAPASWRLAPLLSAHASGAPQTQALVRELVAAIAGADGPPLPPRTHRYVEAPTAYTGEAASIFLGAESPTAPTGSAAPYCAWTRSAPRRSSSTHVAPPTPSIDPRPHASGWCSRQERGRCVDRGFQGVVDGYVRAGDPLRSAFSPSGGGLSQPDGAQDSNLGKLSRQICSALQ
ncbi:hypothetical protein [Streptomyces sp. 2A115]|uniref:hypothetical protein n=1 Tax=Streptomyces sp. 2A115 TaxID=3457439 RepID=UPI003FD5E61B